MDEAAILAATMTDRAKISREEWTGAGPRRETVYENLACALSRGPQSATPGLAGQWEEQMETGSRLTLFFPAGTVILAGDRGEISREGMIFRGICSAGMPYPSHCQASFFLQEVEQA